MTVVYNRLILIKFRPFDVTCLPYAYGSSNDEDHINSQRNWTNNDPFSFVCRISYIYPKKNKKKIMQ